MSGRLAEDAAAFAKALRRSQEVLAETIEPDAEMTHKEAIDELLRILDNEILNARLDRFEK